MNKAIKYVLCIFVAIAVTCAVVFLPYIYYASTDKKLENNYVTETFSLDKVRDTLTSDEIVKLLSSDDAVWLKSNRSNNSDYEVLNNVSNAIQLLSSEFYDNKYALTAFEKLYNITSLEITPRVDEVIVNGKINNSPVSVTLLYLLFESADEYNRGNYSMLIDKKTNIVYEFSCAPYAGIFSDEFLETHELYEQVETNLYEITCSDLKSYWESENSEEINAVTSKEYFYFNIMPVSFTTYAFNNFESAIKLDNEISQDQHEY